MPRYVVVERWAGGIRFHGYIEARDSLQGTLALWDRHGPSFLAIPEKVARKLEPGAVMNEARTRAIASER